MKANRKVSGMIIGCVLLGMAAYVPSISASVVWFDDFNDGNDTGWREHLGTGNDQNAYDVVAGAGVGGTDGYVRAQSDTGGEGIFTTPIPAITGGSYEMSASIKLSPTGSSRTAITWGYDQHGWPVPHYLVAIQNRDHLELTKGHQNIAGYTTLEGGPIVPTNTFDDFVLLSARFTQEGSNLRITAFLNGVQQFTRLDTSPLIFNPSFAGVYTTFGSAGTVFDNVQVQVLVPEPASVSLLAIGLGLVALRRWRK